MTARAPVNEEDLARYLWTIGDVTRLRILEMLPTTPDCCEGKNVSQIAEHLGLTQSTVSNHLARLRTLGIVRHTKQCRDVYYWIDPERADEIVEQLQLALKR
ncbi:MAG: ArsR/SmtB family transcription factor [Puniceicoccaceae bacterium]